MKASMIKKDAKEVLKRLSGKNKLFFIPIILALFYGGIGVVEQTVFLSQSESSWTENVFTLGLNLLVTFFMLSALFTMVDVIRGKRQSVSFSDVQRAFATKMFIPLIIIIMLKNLLLFVWFFAISIGYVILLTSGINSTGIVLIILSVVMFFITLYRYLFVELLFYDYFQNNIRVNPLLLLATSRQFVKGYKRKLFMFHLSFIGWYLLVVATFGLASFYVVPYLLTSNAMFYEKMLKEKRQRQQKVPLRFL